MGWVEVGLAGGFQVVADLDAVDLGGLLVAEPVAIYAVRGTFEKLAGGFIGEGQSGNLVLFGVEGVAVVSVELREDEVGLGLRGGAAGDDAAGGVHHHVFVEPMADVLGLAVVSV